MEHYSGISGFCLEKLPDQMEAANKSLRGKDRHTGVKDLAKEHTEVRQHSGEQRGADPRVHQAVRHPQVCPQCRILYMFVILHTTENLTSQCPLVIVTLMYVAG